MSWRTPPKFRSHHLHRLRRRYQLPRAVFQHPRILPHSHRYLHPLNPRCKPLPSASVSAYLSVSPCLPASFSSSENITERAERFQPTRDPSSARWLGNRASDRWKCQVIERPPKCREMKSSSCMGRSRCQWRYLENEELVHEPPLP